MQTLQQQAGKTVKSIQFHEIVGTLEVHLTDGTTIRAQAAGQGIANLMIVGGNEPCSDDHDDSSTVCPHCSYGAR